MRVGVTGLAGFTGGYLREALEARDHQLVPIASDITASAELAAELGGLQLDAVVHLAGSAFAASADFQSFYQVNQIGTFNLLTALEATAPDRMPVLLASSAHVYGAPDAQVIDEDTPFRPLSHYALSKAAMEMGASWWTKRFRLTIVRPFNYTGRGQEERYLLPKLVSHFAKRSSQIELGNIDVFRDFGDVRDVVAAYCGLLEAANAVGVFNVCTQRVHSVRQLIELAGALTGHRPAIRFNPAFARADEPQSLCGSNQRLLRAVPGWRPRPIEDTLRWMLTD